MWMNAKSNTDGSKVPEKAIPRIKLNIKQNKVFYSDTHTGQIYKEKQGMMKFRKVMIN